jgi:hypothetical protein
MDEVYWYKPSQPTELVAVMVQLAERVTRANPYALDVA